MNDLKLKELRKLVDTVNPEKWERGDRMTPAMWEVVIEFCSSMPELLNLVEKQEKQLEIAKGVLETVVNTVGHHFPCYPRDGKTWLCDEGCETQVHARIALEEMK